VSVTIHNVKTNTSKLLFYQVGLLVAMLLTVEDQEIILDIVEAVISEAPENHRHRIGINLQGLMKEVASQTGNSFEPLAHAIVQLRNTRLQSTHFVSFI